MYVYGTFQSHMARCGIHTIYRFNVQLHGYGATL